MREILRITVNETADNIAVVVSGPASLTPEQLSEAVNFAAQSLFDMIEELNTRTDLASTPVEGSA